jgi:hypothetical protein
MKKVRKKLSIGARVKRKSHAGGDGDLMEGEVKTVTDAEDAVSIHVDEKTGHRYSCNAATGQSNWLSDDEEEDGATMEEQGERKQKSMRRISFRKIVDDDEDVFFQNVETGETVWNTCQSTKKYKKKIQKKYNKQKTKKWETGNGCLCI